MTAITFSGASTPDSKSGVKIRVAGGTISKHDWVYIDTTDNSKVKAADADVEASAVVYGMALHDAVSGEFVMIAIDGAVVTVGGGLTAKTFYYLGTTAGETVPLGDLSSGDYISQVCFANSATELVIDINNTGVAVT
jgi:hypothetical protein